MSTFLVGLVVVAATICVIVVALSDPEQPATIRHPTGRERRRRRPRPRPAPAPPPTPVVARAPAAAAEAAPRRIERRPPAPRRKPQKKPAPGWGKVRSAVALVVLVTFVGVLMAAAMGTSLALAARALRHAVG